VNVIPFASVSAEIEMLKIEDDSNVAVSAAPSGTVMGDQLGALFQLPLAGDVDQVALPANAELTVKMMMSAGKRQRV